MSVENLAEQLADAARELASEGVERTLEKAVGLAVELLEGCDGAGVSLVRRDKSLMTPAATAEWVAKGDSLQYELQEGPCMDAAWREELIVAPDLANEVRWSRWGPCVVNELGVRSMLCVQLFADEETLGALNLYSKHLGAFAGRSERYEAEALAAHVAVALLAAQEIADLNRAVVNRTVIGQAEGILMERFDVDADHAFSILRRVSMNTNVKLHAVARDIVRRRRLPL